VTRGKWPGNINNQHRAGPWLKDLGEWTKKEPLRRAALVKNKPKSD